MEGILRVPRRWLRTSREGKTAQVPVCASNSTGTLADVLTPAHCAHTQRRARVAVCEASRLLADFAIAGGVSTAADRHLRSGDLLDITARIRLYQGLHAAVSVAADHIMYGTPWAEIGRKNGITAAAAEERFGHVVDQIINGDEVVSFTPQTPGIIIVGAPQVNLPDNPGELEQLIATLDHYYARHHQGPGNDPRDLAHQVSRGLPPADN